MCKLYSTRFNTANFNFTCVHELIGIIRDGEDVRWCLNPLLASVSSNNYSIIHRKPLVGIHNNTKQPRIGL